jgi:hypothetical protein
VTTREARGGIGVGRTRQTNTAIAITHRGDRLHSGADHQPAVLPIRLPLTPQTPPERERMSWHFIESKAALRRHRWSWR